jgi:hypothetical protein
MSFFEAIFGDDENSKLRAAATALKERAERAERAARAAERALAESKSAFAEAMLSVESSSKMLRGVFAQVTGAVAAPTSSPERVARDVVDAFFAQNRRLRNIHVTTLVNDLITIAGRKADDAVALVGGWADAATKGGIFDPEAFDQAKKEFARVQVDEMSKAGGLGAFMAGKLREAFPAQLGGAHPPPHPAAPAPAIPVIDTPPQFAGTVPMSMASALKETLERQFPGSTVVIAPCNCENCTAERARTGVGGN